MRTCLFQDILGQNFSDSSNVNSISTLKSQDWTINKFDYLQVYTDFFFYPVTHWTVDILLRKNRPRLNWFLNSKPKLFNWAIWGRCWRPHKGLEITWNKRLITMFRVIFLICKETGTSWARWAGLSGYNLFLQSVDVSESLLRLLSPAHLPEISFPTSGHYCVYNCLFQNKVSLLQKQYTLII